MKRKLLSVFLSLAMVLTMMPVFAMADTSVGGGTPGAGSGSNVEASGINSYEALVKAISDAKDGDTITLAGDIDVTKTILVENKTITLDLAGHRLYNSKDIWNDNDWSLISVRGTADLTISGEGELQAKENDCYGVDVYDKTATVTIKKANVIGNVHAVYVVEGTANIEGGNYSVQQKYPDANKADEFVLNLYDESRENGIAKMVVTGGTFENFNPANCKAEGTGTNFCAIGYTTENSGSKYTVVEGTNTAVANAGVNYNTVSNAIGSYTHVNKMVVTLLSDIKEDVTVPSKKNITLDLNGKTLTNVNNNTITIEEGAELTVTGNGTVDNVTHGKSAIYNKGTATLEKGTFDRSGEKGTADGANGNSYYTVLNHGSMTVESGVKVNNKGGFSSLFENGYYDYNTRDGILNPQLTINGGTFTGGINTIKNDDNATLTINDGTFKNYTQSAFQNHHIATIKGGTFDGENAYAVLNCGSCSSVAAGHDDHETTITGGKFNGTISQTVGKITISGGLFSKEFKKSYCETGLTIIDNTDDSTKANYPKTVGTIKASNNGEIKEESVKGKDDKKVSPAISGEENIAAAEVIVNSVEIPSNEEIKDNTTITEDDKARAVTALVENNKLKLDNGKIPENTTVTVVKETYLEVELTDLNMNNGTNNPTVTMNITPKYNLIAKVESGGNTESITIKPAQDTTVTAPTKISVRLPKATFTEGKKVYINHDNGKNIYVTNVKDSEGTVEFTTNGFSPFVFALSDSSVVAEVNGNAYTSLQAAVDAAEDNAEITIVGGGKNYTATSSKTVKITNGFEKADNHANDIKVTVNGTPMTITPGSSENFIYKINSSSGSSTTTYTVTVGSVSNGTVTSSHKSAASGATVTLTVKPADGYAVEAVTAKDAKGNAVKVTEKDGKYTFAMPASNVTVSASFVKKGEQPAAKLFDDVAQGAYYYDAVKWAVDKGVTNGKTSNLFGSDDHCTRAQIVTFLWRAAGSPAASASVSFTDVKDSDYYAKAVAWAVEKGITNGTGDGKFSPDDTCTRAQCAAFLYRAAGSPEVTDAAAFSDVAADAYYAKAVAWAEKNGITNGLGNGKFGSDNSCTRAQIITFLYRTYQGK